MGDGANSNEGGRLCNLLSEPMYNESVMEDDVALCWMGFTEIIRVHMICVHNARRSWACLVI